VDKVSGWVRVRVRVRNVSFPSGMKLYTCKNLPKVDENRSTMVHHFLPFLEAEHTSHKHIESHNQG